MPEKWNVSWENEDNKHSQLRKMDVYADAGKATETELPEPLQTHSCHHLPQMTDIELQCFGLNPAAVWSHFGLILPILLFFPFRFCFCTRNWIHDFMPTRQTLTLLSSTPAILPFWNRKVYLCHCKEIYDLFWEYVSCFQFLLEFTASGNVM